MIGTSIDDGRRLFRRGFPAISEDTVDELVRPVYILSPDKPMPVRAFVVGLLPLRIIFKPSTPETGQAEVATKTFFKFAVWNIPVTRRNPSNQGASTPPE